MSNNTIITIGIVAILTIAFAKWDENRRPEPTTTASLKCPAVERVVLAAPVNGVVNIVCRAQ